MNDLADEATRGFPAWFGAAADIGHAAEADEGGLVYLYLLDEEQSSAHEVCSTVYQAMLEKDPTLMSGFMLFVGQSEGLGLNPVRCGGAWWTWWWNGRDG